MNNKLQLAMLSIFANNYNRDGEGDGDGDGGNGGGATFTQVDLDNAVNAAVGEASKGFKAKNGELLNEVKTLKAASKQWEGLNPDEVNNMMSVFKNNEEAQLIKEGKFEDVIAKRMDKVTTEHNTALTALTEERDGLSESAGKYKALYENKFIDDAMKDLAASTNARPEALKNISRDARDMFKVDEDGELVALDKDGNLVKTAKGDLMTPERFIEELKVSNPYYWPDSVSGGHGGGGGGGESTIDILEAKIAEAAEAGDMTAYNKYRNELEAAKKK